MAAPPVLSISNPTDGISPFPAVKETCTWFSTNYASARK